MSRDHNEIKLPRPKREFWQHSYYTDLCGDWKSGLYLKIGTYDEEFLLLDDGSITTDYRRREVDIPPKYKTALEPVAFQFEVITRQYINAVMKLIEEAEKATEPLDEELEEEYEKEKRADEAHEAEPRHCKVLEEINGSQPRED